MATVGCIAGGQLSDLAPQCQYSGQPVIARAEKTVTATSQLNSSEPTLISFSLLNIVLVLGYCQGHSNTMIAIYL